MDRSLDEIIGELPARGRGGGRGGRGRGRGRGDSDRRPPPPVSRAPRREEYPRDGVRKYRRDEPTNLDSEWVHDRFEEDRYDRRGPRAPADDDRYGPRGSAPSGTKIKIDNVHYELTEDDLRELFERVGPTVSVRLLYDRSDRSTGTAFVIYEDERDARDAFDKFDGCPANGQAIRLTIVPNGPAERGPPPRALADRVERPPRSIFDRIEGGRREDSRDGGRRRRVRSDSPRRQAVDSYPPRSRSPVRRRGTPRGGRGEGRRPGERREERGGRPARKPRTDEEGRSLVGGRPRKTAEELDAEMNDYWGSKGDAPAAESNGNGAANGENGAGDIDMDI
ncbi:Putative RNA recognition motif domain, nucleotide-binding alpha-beta plait domain superfamily [Septoria linicola]|uniref:RNA recognition motif domain, nucleotide-binding alpha-beta plait domain superfamily n=1 Tax=Septoria linicola TaxID=215465 RepID=A0A9Q9AMI1_9PEZI|nr:Putative RNA recognition motif domain, nucleotide-binding alpha-beta plait domain superfamily [Septoria linicola]